MSTLVTFHDTLPDDAAPEDRYARQRLLPWWDQERLARARIVVAGAGAVGNEVLKLLALVGVGTIIVVDFDEVSTSNLSRTVLFRADDVGRPKATLAAERTRAINPEIRVIAIEGDVGREPGLATLAGADLVLGGLDSINARWILNRRCLRAGVPWINGGITATDVQVSRHVPGQGACYECTFTPGMARRFTDRYSCTGLVRRTPDRTVPTTAVGASIVAGLMVHDALRYLHDPAAGLHAGQRQTLLLDAWRQFVDDLPADPDCPAHVEPIRDWLPFVGAPADTSTRAVIAATDLPGADRLMLSFEIVLGFTCPACGTREAVGRPTATVYEDEILCPDCRQERVVSRGTEILRDDPLAERPLAHVGVPPHDLVRVGDGDGAGIWRAMGGDDPWAMTGALPAAPAVDAAYQGRT